MRLSALFAVAAAIALPVSVNAQSPQPANRQPLAQSSFRMDFGTKKTEAAKPKLPVGQWVSAPVAPTTPTGIDCQMVKPIDPNFHSAMPIVKPSTDKKYSLRVIPVPPCKQ